MWSKQFVQALALALAGAAPASGQAPPAPDSLRLGPGDAVRVEAFLAAGETARPALPSPGDYLVGSDGWSLLPVVGLIQVSGRPFGEVRREVEEAFAGRYVDARVRVTPLIRVALLGEVRTPGLLPVDPTMSLADVLAAAGGLTASADRGNIRLVRGEGTVLVTAEGDLPALAVPLRSGDRVVVGRRSWAAENLPFLVGAGASVVAAVLTALIVR